MGRKTRPVVESRIKENLGLNRREDIESARNLTAWRGVLFSSATVASRTIFLSLASSATWPLVYETFWLPSFLGISKSRYAQ